MNYLGSTSCQALFFVRIINPKVATAQYQKWYKVLVRTKMRATFVKIIATRDGAAFTCRQKKLWTNLKSL